MSKVHFLETVQRIAGAIGDKRADGELATFLNATSAADGADFARLNALCAEGERDVWLLAREAAGVKFGRVVKPAAEAGRFSVDVDGMKDVKGPPSHTHSEIGGVMPIAGAPRFDGRAEASLRPRQRSLPDGDGRRRRCALSHA